jgi:hypothetical protein
MGYDFIVNIPERGLLARHSGEHRVFDWKSSGDCDVRIGF